MNHLNRLKHHTCAFIAIWCFLGAISSGEQPREIVNSIGMKLVFIPEGEFLMGAPPDEDGSREGKVGAWHFGGQTKLLASSAT